MPREDGARKQRRQNPLIKECSNIVCHNKRNTHMISARHVPRLPYEGAFGKVMAAEIEATVVLLPQHFRL